MASGIEAAKREVNLVDVREMLGKLNDHADRLVGKTYRLQEHVRGPEPKSDTAGQGRPPAAGLVMQLSDLCSDLGARLHAIEENLNTASVHLGVPPSPTAEGPVRLARG